MITARKGRPLAALLNNGERLHLQHGPIDLIIGADADTDAARQQAFAAANCRFQTLLEGLAADLHRHRAQLLVSTPTPSDPVAQRMYRAARPFCQTCFVTPMVAVAGAVADEVLHAMMDATPLRRAHVNNGGDIALHLDRGTEFSIAMAAVEGTGLGCLRVDAASGIGGIATSGTGGRSLSLGIADSVTVAGTCAAAADVAATLIANAVDLPWHSGIVRIPAMEFWPDSDLGNHLVVTGVPLLTAHERASALNAGQELAASMVESGWIFGAALFLQGDAVTVGAAFAQPETVMMEMAHA